jgi:4-amino-4-deoxy-L-arabinose transferase-like glycosyltransferase
MACHSIGFAGAANFGELSVDVVVTRTTSACDPLASRLAPPPSALAFGRIDLITVAGFLLVAFVLLIYRSDALPLQIWDESRIANNALEAAMDGHWLVPTDHGYIDHWNTKPPLLPWLMAAGMRVGLPALWAVRLPSIAAAVITGGLIWAALRIALKDRLAAAIGLSLLFGSILYVGLHGSRNGDYESLESLFILGYVLSFWAASDVPARTNWLFAAAACIVGAVMTKGVAGLLPLPGCAVFLLADRRRFLSLLGDWRAWFCALGAIAAILGYYLSREAYDPGYLKAVYASELGGRFAAVSEEHFEGPLFYIGELAKGFLPGAMLLPFVAVSIFRGERRRRDLALLCVAGCVSLLAVLTAASTKLFHYVIPAVPLLCLAAAIGVSDTLRILATSHPARGRRLAIGVGALCATGLGMTIFLSQALFARSFPEIQDGAYLADLHRAGERAPVTVVDERLLALPGGGPPGRRYSQIIDFYARLYRADWPIAQSQEGWPLATPSLAITCTSTVFAWLGASHDLRVVRRGDGCVLVRLAAPRGRPAPTPS